MGGIVLLVLIGVHVVFGAPLSTDYDGQQTLGGCINTFERQVTQSPRISCSLFQPYLKCVIRVTKLYTYPVGHDQYTALDNQVSAQLENAGLDCQFDIEAISAQVAREQNGRAIPTAKPEIPNADYDVDADATDDLWSTELSDYEGQQTLDGCINTLKRLTAQSPSISCSLFQPYLKCAIRVTKLYTYPVGHDQYTALDNQVSAQLENAGLDCQFDIEAISAQVAREQNGRAIPAAKPEIPNADYDVEADATNDLWSTELSDFDRQQTLDGCINTLKRQTAQSPSISCSLFQRYLKCAVRVTKLYTYPVGHDQYTALDNQVSAQLENAGLDCQFDIEAISAEVAREQNSRAISATAEPEITNADYNGDQSIEDCINTFTEINKRNPSLSCSQFRPYLKCLMRVTKLYKYPIGEEKYTSLDSQVNSKLSDMGLDCKFDLEAIAAEVGKEQKLSKRRSWIRL